MALHSAFSKLDRSLQAQRTPLSCPTHCCRATVSRTPVPTISGLTARTSSSRYSFNNDLYLQTTLYGLRHTRTARPLVSLSLNGVFR
ncbi:uncharacterized protein LACBIDRAFT_295995 [Laccaria bicolor S238N-H82]|uniref:Predicted protein n=1 Tax=Laccaria bicolor (strain S238N-H82 / ATCC MYA-4686) TaxID=486041 RepID=B0E1J2_LACBS|nr:uncharacterized protein LACBIDRAFT_295995 [Laccaria bicolor S238N-H82]EDQ99248.1 predicted protein [Laccaria bicolor S238N-H82]|eukprot:XP_001890058.1 predicted protein [Laccaria bicolor S238N-H82]